MWGVPKGDKIVDGTLSASGLVARDDANLLVAYAPPQSDLQRAICDAFTSELGIAEVGLDDDFFDLGGDSLNGEALSIRLSEVLSRNFPISALLDHSTPRLIEAGFSGDVVTEAMADSPPIFLVHGMVGYTMLQPEFRSGLVDGRQVEIFELPGLRDDRETPHRVEGIAAAYVEELLAKQPDGPILLASFCTGALIAIEMAQQLARQRRQVERLVLIDPGMPRELQRRYSGRSDTLSRRILNFPITGRFTGRVGAKDFEDDRLLRFNARIKEAKFKLRAARHYRKLGQAKLARRSSYNTYSMSLLSSAFRHYWPAPYEGRTDVICSENRARILRAPDRIWAHVLPNRQLHVVLNAHSDINTKIAAETMEFALATK